VSRCQITVCSLREVGDNGSGEVWIAEIKSRFVDPKFNAFVTTLGKMGLKLLEMDTTEKMFVLMRFEKTVQTTEDDEISEDKLLKACLYKKR
jgi:ribosomal RNA-processing protein 8